MIEEKIKTIDKWVNKYENQEAYVKVLEKSIDDILIEQDNLIVSFSEWISSKCEYISGDTWRIIGTTEYRKTKQLLIEFKRR